MTSSRGRALRGESGFNTIELMVVVVIIGILSTIAVPIYLKYVRNSRLAEATSRMGELLESARLYATEHESNGNPRDADWPANCAASGFIGSCNSSNYFTYSMTGNRNGPLIIVASGKSGTSMASVRLTIEITDPTSSAPIVIAIG